MIRAEVVLAADLALPKESFLPLQLFYPATQLGHRMAIMNLVNMGCNSRFIVQVLGFLLRIWVKQDSRDGYRRRLLRCKIRISIVLTGRSLLRNRSSLVSRLALEDSFHKPIWEGYRGIADNGETGGGESSDNGLGMHSMNLFGELFMDLTFLTFWELAYIYRNGCRCHGE
jgi:hypothetical protein